MSGENCFGSSENIGNRPKTQYSTDFGIEPIEYIYVWYMEKFWKTKHKYGLKLIESKSIYILSINKIFDIKSILTMNSNLQIRCATF
jgi:hypothetical protein